MKGHVKFYRIDLGWGFVHADGRDYFVHHENMHPEKLYIGQTVQFEVITTKRGDMAVDVRIIETKKD